MVVHPSPTSAATATIRFRLRTGAFRNADGWYIDDVEFGGISSVPASRGAETGLASRVSPNPFASAAIISYTLPSAGPVEISIFDALGRRVARPLDGDIGAGPGSITFDATGHPDGIYYYEIRHRGGVARGSMILARGTRP